MPVSSSIELITKSTLQSQLDHGVAEFPSVFSKRFAFLDGIGADKIKKIFSDKRTITASELDALDLDGGLTDAFGASISFDNIKGIIIAAPATNAGSITVGGAASNAFASPFGAANDKITIQPGGLLVLMNPTAAGYDVTASTGDILDIQNDVASSVDYDIVLIGE